MWGKNVKMVMKKTMNTRANGAITPLMVIVIVVLFVVGVGVLTLGFYGRLLGIRASMDISARCAADAGLTKAVVAMNEKLKVKPWDGTVLPQEADEALPNFDAVYSFTITESNADSYAVQTVGHCGSSDRMIDSTLRLQGPWEFAVFARRDINLRANTVIDWYNFDADDDTLRVGTNSILPDAVTLKSDTLVNGDIVVGLGGNPSSVINCYPGVNITGRTYAMTEQYELPAVVVPEYLETSPSKGVISGSMTISSSGKYDGINLGNSAVVTINEPVVLYITGDIRLGNSSQIRIGGSTDTDNDASLKLFLGGNIEGKNGIGFNNETKQPKNFELYALNTCTSIDFKNGSDFYGAMYAPSANLILRNSGDIYGSFASDSFEMKETGTIHYDASLRNRSTSDELVRFVIKRWNEQ